MKKLTKILNLSWLALLLSSIPSPTYALTQGEAQELFPLPGIFGTIADPTHLITNIVRVLLIAAGLAAFIYLIVGGYQYVTAGGNAEQATAARTTILNAIIGLVIIFASYALITWFLMRFLR